MSFDPQSLGLWTAALAGGGAAALAGVRRLSRARVDVAKDEAERDMLKRVLKELDDARVEITQLQAAGRLASSNLARAEAEKEAMRREVDQLGEEFGAFQRKMARLYPETRDFMDSNVVPLSGFSGNAP